MKLIEKIFKRNDWYITSKFGYRKIINTEKGKTKKFHNGCDYGTYGQKWPQYSIESGTILDCGVDNDGAKYIWIYYPRIKIKLLHYHLDKICVKKNQVIEGVTLLGYTGDTGKTTGVHLHLGLKLINNNDYQDPHEYDYKEVNDNNKDVDDVVDEVIDGKWGNGKERVEKLTSAGYDAVYIQNRVNDKLYNNSIIYIVKKGDSLIKIAKKYNINYEKMYENNKNVIGEDPNLIIPGTKLIIR